MELNHTIHSSDKYTCSAINKNEEKCVSMIRIRYDEVVVNGKHW